MDPTLVAAIIAVIVSGFGAWFGFKGKRVEVKGRDDANLRDDQREFIAVQQRDNADLRARVASLEAIIDSLRKQVADLTDKLYVETRNRKAAEARRDAEQSTRDELSAVRSAGRQAGAGQVAEALDDDDEAAEETIRRAGAAAERKSRAKKELP